MGDLGIDTSLRPVGEGRFRGRLSRDWEIWGPMGGYLASFALRAAGAHCGLPRPASLVGHYLGVGTFHDDRDHDNRDHDDLDHDNLGEHDLEIECTTLRRARTAESVRVTIAQDGRPLFEALVWGVTTGLAGLDHHASAMPVAPHWRDCPTVEERVAAAGLEYEAWYPFWNNLDQRPPRWRDDWNERATRSEPPEWMQWLRFRPAATFADPWLDACRLLILVDLGSWPAVQGHHNQGDVIAPSIDIACEFHRIDPAAEWLFAAGHAPSAADGLIGAHMHVWNDSGVLLASGVSQLLCRPVPAAPT